MIPVHTSALRDITRTYGVAHTTIARLRPFGGVEGVVEAGGVIRCDARTTGCLMASRTGSYSASHKLRKAPTVRNHLLHRHLAQNL
jgi:hypothetical protein